MMKQVHVSRPKSLAILIDRLKVSFPMPFFILFEISSFADSTPYITYRRPIFFKLLSNSSSTWSALMPFEKTKLKRCGSLPMRSQRSMTLDFLYVKQSSMIWISLTPNLVASLSISATTLSMLLALIRIFPNICFVQQKVQWPVQPLVVMIVATGFRKASGGI